MNDEVSESKSIKMKPSIVFKAHRRAIEQGKTLGRWSEKVIEERAKEVMTEKID